MANISLAQNFPSPIAAPIKIYGPNHSWVGINTTNITGWWHPFFFVKGPFFILKSTRNLVLYKIIPIRSFFFHVNPLNFWESEPSILGSPFCKLIRHMELFIILAPIIMMIALCACSNTYNRFSFHFLFLMFGVLLQFILARWLPMCYNRSN